MALAEDAAATKPNRASRLGPLCSHHQPLLPTDPRTTPNALSPLRRHHPREEPGALAAHAGICAGGDRKRSSLPRPRAGFVERPNLWNIDPGADCHSALMFAAFMTGHHFSISAF